MKGAREGKRAKKKETRKARERCLATLAPDRRDLPPREGRPPSAREGGVGGDQVGSWKWLPVDGKPVKAVGEHEGKIYTFDLPQDEMECQKWLQEISAARDKITDLIPQALVARAQRGLPAHLHEYVSRRLGGAGPVHDHVMKALVAAGKQTRGAPSSDVALSRSRERAQMFLAEVSQGRNKTTAYEAVSEKFGADERTIRNDVKQYERVLKLLSKADERNALLDCLDYYRKYMGWRDTPRYKVSPAALAEHFGSEINSKN